MPSIGKNVGGVFCALAVLLAPAVSHATKIPLPIEGATLNLSLQIQTQFLVNEAGTPDGQNPSYDIFVRRTRLLVNGDVNGNFSYLLQLDNANFGKFGNFGGRAIVQDAWVGWAPTGITGGTVVYIDGGLLLIPSRATCWRAPPTSSPPTCREMRFAFRAVPSRHSVMWACRSAAGRSTRSWASAAVSTKDTRR